MVELQNAESVPKRILDKFIYKTDSFGYSPEHMTSLRPLLGEMAQVEWVI